MVSTPNAPEGLFERVEKDPEDTCLYKRIFLDYTMVLAKYIRKKKLKKPNNHLRLNGNIISSIKVR
jgi:hypothetical protein